MYVEREGAQSTADANFLVPGLGFGMSLFLLLTWPGVCSTSYPIGRPRL